ncbi:TetR family transcriptional regulator [Embleya sp. NPDC008237]|uniref:acyl-CoA-like ligand-binding transcription factor n=1 Tax=Embleya sp. NPDC008237 TaxID=3363978 RepID=UPI0036EEAF3A
MTAKEPSIPDLPGSPVGLRERKKIKTRQAIRREAYRLFREHGYDATTVDRIAEAAEISPSTFFRYFPTKEDIVLTDEYDPILVEVIRTAPKGLSLLRVLRTGLLDALREIIRVDGEEMATRMTLVLSVPALRRRTYEQQMQSWSLIAETFAARNGRSTDDLELRVAAAAINAAMSEAIMAWARRDCAEDLVELVDRALGLLETGLRDRP